MIKDTRRLIAHGHAYFYDFRDDSAMQHLILLLDRLIRDMSLRLVGFSNAEIEEYPIL